MLSVIAKVRIGPRLIMAFSIAIMSSLILGFYAERAVVSVAESNTRLYNHPFTVTNALREINANIIGMHRSMKDVALATDPSQIDAALADVNTREKLVHDRFKLVKERYLGNQEDIDQLVTAFAEWRPIRESVVQKYKEGKREEAAGITKTYGSQKVREIEEKIAKLLDSAMSKAASFKEKVEETGRDLKIGIFVAIGLSVTISAGAAYAIHRSIAGPINGITGTMGALSAGDYAVAIMGCDRRDEVGDMARAIKGFKEQLVRVRSLEEDQERARLQAEADRRAAMHKMADEFERTVGHVVDALTSSAGELKSSSDVMSSAASETSAQVTTVASAAHQASANVQTVASATEELAASIKEIDTQVKRSHAAANRASTEAARTTTKIRTLSDNVNKIGEIVTLINNIAAQTNLLALNATIEAARAGEAGKGFAVVASEVKSLANQTARATEEIAAQISAVQQGTTESVAAIDMITHVITELGEVSAAVSSAVEQQTGATSEIARNVEQAASGTEEVSSNISLIEQATQRTGRISGSIQLCSDQLSEKSGSLQREMQHFLENVRRG